VTPLKTLVVQLMRLTHQMASSGQRGAAVEVRRKWHMIRQRSGDAEAAILPG
jgi:hypothetical protein